MRNFSPISALALLAASTAVQAEEQYNMNMPCFNDICWTSWRCYYNRMSKYDGKIGNRCGVPGNVYTPALDGARRNTLVWDEKYYLEWAFDWEQDSRKEEIILEWLMFEAPGTESKSFSIATVADSYEPSLTSSQHQSLLTRQACTQTGEAKVPRNSLSPIPRVSDQSSRHFHCIIDTLHRHQCLHSRMPISAFGFLVP
jgi:hypothetical protein